jgi:fatty-acyl-CoA synthase
MRKVRKTIGRVLENVSQQFPRKDALVHMDARVRYNHTLLWWEAERVARGLIQMGLGPKDRVALWAPNIPEWITSMLALIRMGAVLVPIDPGANGDELHFVMENSGCRAAIIAKGMEGEEYVEMMLGVKGKLPSLEHIFVAADATYPGTLPWAELTGMGDSIDTTALRKCESRITPDDPAAIIYTSGTTGIPKGVVLDHLGIINKSIFSTSRQGLRPEDKLCLFFPLFHMFGNTCIALAGLFTGASLVMPCQTFDPVKILQAIAKERCTAVYGSPSMLISLLDHPEFRKKHWRSVTKGTIGGAPCPIELMRRLVKEIGVTDITVGYGITEASSWITMTHPKDPIELRVSTIGKTLECNEVKIVDPVSGEPLPPKTQGELCTKGYLMKEYYKMPAATSAAIDGDGWFHTGDLGEMDEKGYVKITGRLKDVIVRDGVEIYPVELEEILYQLPDVSEAQVFGFPHPKMGHEVAAWVKVKEGARLSTDDIERHARDHMDAAKVPAFFKIVTKYPMTRSGKIQKFRLAEMAEREYEQKSKGRSPNDK